MSLLVSHDRLSMTATKKHSQQGRAFLAYQPKGRIVSVDLPLLFRAHFRTPRTKTQLPYCGKVS